MTLSLMVPMPLFSSAFISDHGCIECSMTLGSLAWAKSWFHR
jgi:hypothetical protein